MKTTGDIQPPGFKFEPITEQETLLMFNKMPNSIASGISEIPFNIVKASIKNLLPFITYLFNSCLKEGLVPDEWKTAVVTPLYKRKGDVNDMNNYRGISILPFMSKLFEKLVAKQMYRYFETNNLFYDECLV